jgi:hypothetical protein
MYVPCLHHNTPRPKEEGFPARYTSPPGGQNMTLSQMRERPSWREDGLAEKWACPEADPFRGWVAMRFS